jgi:hypothetical protein
MTGELLVHISSGCFLVGWVPWSKWTMLPNLRSRKQKIRNTNRPWRSEDLSNFARKLANLRKAYGGQVDGTIPWISVRLKGLSLKYIVSTYMSGPSPIRVDMSQCHCPICLVIQIPQLANIRFLGLWTASKGHKAGCPAKKNSSSNCF